jgi:hypothetical protein
MPLTSRTFRFCHPNNIGKEYIVWSSSFAKLCNFHQHLVTYFFPPTSKYSSQHPVLKHTQSVFFSNMRAQVSHLMLDLAYNNVLTLYAKWKRFVYVLFTSTCELLMFPSLWHLVAYGLSTRKCQLILYAPGTNPLNLIKQLHCYWGCSFRQATRLATNCLKLWDIWGSHGGEDDYSLPGCDVMWTQVNTNVSEKHTVYLQGLERVWILQMSSSNPSLGLDLNFKMHQPSGRPKKGRFLLSLTPEPPPLHLLVWRLSFGPNISSPISRLWLANSHLAQPFCPEKCGQWNVCKVIGEVACSASEQICFQICALACDIVQKQNQFTYASKGSYGHNIKHLTDVRCDSASEKYKKGACRKLRSEDWNNLYSSTNINMSIWRWRWGSCNTHEEMRNG